MTPELLQKRLSANLKKARKQLSFSQEKLAEEAHISVQMMNIISRKSGQKIPKIANLQYYKSKANYGTKKKGISR